MFPELEFGHVVKDAYFMDCSNPTNLMYTNPFQRPFPSDKGDCFDDQQFYDRCDVPYEDMEEDDFEFHAGDEGDDISNEGGNVEGSDSSRKSKKDKSKRMPYRRPRESTASSLGSDRSRSRSRRRSNRNSRYSDDLNDCFTFDDDVADDDVFVSPNNSGQATPNTSRGSSRRASPNNTRNSSSRRNSTPRSRRQRTSSDTSNLGQDFEGNIHCSYAHFEITNSSHFFQTGMSVDPPPFPMVRLTNPGAVCWFNRRVLLFGHSWLATLQQVVTNLLIFKGNLLISVETPQTN